MTSPMQSQLQSTLPSVTAKKESEVVLASPPIIEKSIEATLEEVMNQRDMDVKQYVPRILGWTKQYAILSDWHINNIILTLMSSVKFLKNVEIELDKPNKHVKYIFILGLWSLWSKKRIRVLNHKIDEVHLAYAPEYSMEIGYKYGK